MHCEFKMAALLLNKWIQKGALSSLFWRSVVPMTFPLWLLSPQVCTFLHRGGKTRWCRLTSKRTYVNPTQERRIQSPVRRRTSPILSPSLKTSTCWTASLVRGVSARPTSSRTTRWNARRTSQTALWRRSRRTLRPQARLQTWPPNRAAIRCHHLNPALL